jgi:hypothetical protein
MNKFINRSKKTAERLENFAKGGAAKGKRTRAFKLAQRIRAAHAKADALTFFVGGAK